MNHTVWTIPQILGIVDTVSRSTGFDFRSGPDIPDRTLETWENDFRLISVELARPVDSFATIFCTHFSWIIFAHSKTETKDNDGCKHITSSGQFDWYQPGPLTQYGRLRRPDAKGISTLTTFSFLLSPVNLTVGNPFWWVQSNLSEWSIQNLHFKVKLFNVFALRSSRQFLFCKPT